MKESVKKRIEKLEFQVKNSKKYDKVTIEIVPGEDLIIRDLEGNVITGNEREKIIESWSKEKPKSIDKGIKINIID